MGTLLSPINYGVTSAAKPLVIGEGDDKQSAASYQDYLTTSNMLEEMIGQLITQHNSALNTQEQTISTGVPSALDTGTATTAQIAAAVNSIISILTNLNTAPK